MHRRAVFLMFFFFLTGVSPAGSESIRNYGDCKLCHGTITYGPDEARKLLGQGVMDALSRLADRQNVVLYVDRDSAFPATKVPEPQNAYELKVIVTDQLLYVTVIEDGSSLMMEIDQGNRGHGAFHPESFSNWNPVIYLGAHEEDEIKLEDGLETAWTKLKASGVHRLIHSFDHDFEAGLKATVLFAIEAVGA